MEARKLALALGVMTAANYGCALDWEDSNKHRDASTMDGHSDASSADAPGDTGDASTEADASTPDQDAKVVPPDASTDEDDASEPQAPEEPPKTGLRAWFRGDECPMSADGNFVECTDLSQTGSTLKNNTAKAASIKQAGIGGLRSVSATHGWFKLDSGNMRSDRFTITTVHRANFTGQGNVIVWSFGEEITTGDATQTQSARLIQRTSSADFAWWTDLRKAGPGAIIDLQVPATPPSKTEAGAIVTLVADAASGTRIYINGVRVGGSSLAVPTFLLNVGLLYREGASEPPELAEALLYGRPLSDNELSLLHRYLGARYGIALDGLQEWLDVDDIVASRKAADGISPNSGLGVASKDKLYDRFTGFEYTTSGTPPGGPSVFDESGTRYGLDSGGGPSLSLSKYGSNTCHVPAGSPSCSAKLEHCSNPDFLELVVLRIDENAGDIPLWFSGTLAPPAQSVSLKGNTSTQTVRLEWVDDSNKTTTKTSANGVLPLGKPLLLGIHSSAPDTSIHVSINGKVELSMPQHACPSGTSGSAPVLHLPPGALAERRLYRGPFNAAQVKRLHREIAQKYSIDVP